MTTHNLLASKRSPFAMLGMVLLLLGCGGCKARLTGTVSLQGEHLEGGSVVFVGPDSRPVTTRIKEDGTYEFEDIPTGEARLAVYGPRRNFRFGGIFIISGNAKVESKKRPTVPAKYNDFDQSELRTTIRYGANSYDIEME
jgi:hypothetical protein